MALPVSDPSDRRRERRIANGKNSETMPGIALHFPPSLYFFGDVLCSCMDVFRSFIQKLKTKGGCHFTIKLEGMITDINISEDFRKKFRDWYRKKTAGEEEADKKNEDETSSTVNIKGIGFSAHVLKSG